MKVGSLCTGYGGLELALQLIWPNVGWSWAGPTWVSEIDPHANTVLQARYPEAPNIGDLAGADPEPVDIITAGFPCQPLSTAGHRRGLDDERWIWDDIEALIRRMDPPPRMLMLENVPGLLTANDGEAMARIVQGLASAGYMGRYRLHRAADIGAAHQRRRWFCVATHRDAPHPPSLGIRSDARADSRDETSRRQPNRTSLPARKEVAHPEDPPPSHLPTPQASDGTRGPDYARANRRDTHDSGGDDLTTAMALLGTPKARDHKDESLPPYLEETTRTGLPKDIAMLPTPTAMDMSGSRNKTGSPNPTGRTLNDVRYEDIWGDYIDAIRHHENILGRPAPSPTTNNRLAPRFVEWMMMLPQGWVTDIGLSRRHQLRILGNGVVPPQAAAAYQTLLQ